MKMPQSRRQSTVMITWAVLAALALAPSVSAQEDGTISGTVKEVLPPLSVGEMTLRLYSALNYRQNSVRDLRFALNGA